jgi:hypothetical protein
MSKTCNTCILSDEIGGIVINADGSCNYCTDHSQHVPYGEQKLHRIIAKAKKKNNTYDALVPLSGGKDSTYVLYLAVKEFRLKVLTYTFDNGFMSELALKNIGNTTKSCNVDHVWIKPDADMLLKLYRTALTESGEICGICGIGIERSMLRISEAWKIPLILLGHVPTESNSFTGENLYDAFRMKTILKRNKNISGDEIRRFLIFPNINFITSWLQTKTGRFGKKVNILYYLDLPSEKRIAEILKSEMNWADSDHSGYTRHFDCLAEPFTNFIREKRFGSSRRIFQLSNMVRNNEISRDEALSIWKKDIIHSEPANFHMIKERLRLTDSDIGQIARIPAHVFDENISVANKVFAMVRKSIKGNRH